MSFFTCVAVASALSICAGAALSCLVCMLCGAACKKPYQKNRFVVFCLFASAACVCAAVLLIFALEPFKLYVHSPFYLVYAALLFVVAFLCAVFWKLLFPLVIVLYTALSAVTGITMYMLFGAQKDSIELSVQREGISVDGVFYGYDAELPSGIDFAVYTLPAPLLVPLPRVWYVPVLQQGGTVPYREFLQDKPLASLLTAFFGWCLSDRRTVTVPFEGALTVPVLYTCTVTRSGEAVSFTLHRDL